MVKIVPPDHIWSAVCVAYAEGTSSSAPSKGLSLRIENMPILFIMN